MGADAAMMALFTVMASVRPHHRRRRQETRADATALALGCVGLVGLVIGLAWSV